MQELLLEMQSLLSRDTKSPRFCLLSYLHWANGDVSAGYQVQMANDLLLRGDQLQVVNPEMELQELQMEEVMEARLAQVILQRSRWDLPVQLM